jgi:hypothetical protein
LVKDMLMVVRSTAGEKLRAPSADAAKLNFVIDHRFGRVHRKDPGWTTVAKGL